MILRCAKSVRDRQEEMQEKIVTVMGTTMNMIVKTCPVRIETG